RLKGGATSWAATIVGRNEAEAAKDAADRQAIVSALDQQLTRGAKGLIGNSAYGRSLPIYHSSGAAIRGHVFCSFLALILRKELDERCRAAGFRPEWGDVLRD